MPFLTQYTIPQGQAEAVPVGLTWSSTPGTFVTVNPPWVYTLLGLTVAWYCYRRFYRGRR